MKIQRHRTFFGIILVSCFLISHARAQQNLSEPALFHRCFSQLTQSRAKPSEPLLAQVQSGAKTALQACAELLDRARFTAENGTRIGDPADPLAKAVLFSMHQLHNSWSRQELGVFDPGIPRSALGTQTWYDEYPFGAYSTRALFAPNQRVRTVVTGSDYLQTVRSTMDPPRVYMDVPRAGSPTVRAQGFTLGSEHPFAPQGELLGIRAIERAPVYLTPSTRLPVQYTVLDFANVGVPPKAIQTLQNINFPELGAVKGPLAEIDNFGIRIQGRLKVSTAGSYTFSVDVDDSAMLLINGNLEIDRTQIGTGSSAPITLSAGEHDFELRYRQRVTTAKLVASWQGPGFAKQVIPSTALVGLQAEYYTESRPAPISLTGHEGGGFLGSHNYLLTAFIENDRAFRPDGAEHINRSWARAVLKDALCREVPVVRESDVTQFVLPNSSVPFRRAAACTSCHATLDRQAGVIRGLRYNDAASREFADPPLVLHGIFGVHMIAPSFRALDEWADVPDTRYPQRQARGQFYFRNYRGELVDRALSSVEELGALVAEQDDFYTCFAQRYYHYFLGIKVELADPGSITAPQLNKPDLYHRNKVIELGLRLRSHQSLRQLILEILGTEAYRRTDFGITITG
jgi:hypothetical protein